MKSRFDRQLVEKYDRPGPRYTSYPTAPHFRDDFGASDHAALLAASRAGGAPLSVYLHIPFCETRCFFCGCNVVISRDRGRARHYLERLAGEISLVAERLGEGRRTVQLHWGGGTPTFLPPEDVLELMDVLRRHFDLADGCEIGVEVDPRHCSEEHLDALVEAGVNRLSMGVQDVDPAVQAAINRLQPPAMTGAVLEGARSRGVDSINLDLIYGLPHQSPESFAATLEQVVRWSPDRLAIFNFAYLPTLFPHQGTLDPESLPDAGSKLTILEHTIETLTAAGYVFIGMDHFARPEDPLARALDERSLTRNFQGYSTCGETDLVALGVSSISQVGGGYAQNRKVLAAYDEAVSRHSLATERGLVLSPEDHLRRQVILSLMSHFRLDLREVEEAHEIDFEAHFRSELDRLRPFAEDGLLEIGAEAIEVTPVGRLLVRNVAMVFDAYLEPAAEVRYSRTV